MNINLIPSLLSRWLRPSVLSIVGECGAARPLATVVSLRRNQVFTIPKQPATRCLEVRRGTVWLTGTPAERDVVLQAEETLCLANGHPFVLEALADAEIILTSR